jgi:hypothetical protein
MKVLMRNVNAHGKTPPLDLTVKGQSPRPANEEFDFGAWPGSVWFGFGDRLGATRAGIFCGGFHAHHKAAKKFRRVLSDAIEVAEGNKHAYPRKYSEVAMTVVGRRNLGKIIFTATSHDRDPKTQKICGQVALCFTIGLLTGQFWTPLADAKKLLELLDKALAVAKPAVSV